MFNFDVEDIITWLIPPSWRRVITIAWLRLFNHPFILTATELSVFQSDNNRIADHNAQLKTLEKYLNDIFDPALKRIYISSPSDLSRMVLHNLIEQKPKTYWYNKWKITTPYNLNNRVVDEDGVFSCIIPNTGVKPTGNPSHWRFSHTKPVIRNKAQYLFHEDFIVHVHTSIVFDLNRMKAEVNRKKLAGTNYIIQTYS